MFKKIKQFSYLAFWFLRARFFGRKAPLQSVIFISDKCNLQCKHCSVYQLVNPNIKSYEQVCEDIRYCYSIGSRFIDFEGGEPCIWRDGDKTVNDLIDYAKSIGFFSCTITTNAQKDFSNSHADSIWVSLDGVGEYHNAVRGNGVFERLEKNVAACGHPAVSFNMAINTLNKDAVAATIEYAEKNPAIKSISLNFHTPFEGTEYLALSMEERAPIIDLILDYKKRGYKIMNSRSGLKKMKKMDFKTQCWVTNFIFSDGTKTPTCIDATQGVCDQCGFCMAGEMNSVFNFHPDTIFAGLNLRL